MQIFLLGSFFRGFYPVLSNDFCYALRVRARSLFLIRQFETVVFAAVFHFERKAQEERHHTK